MAALSLPFVVAAAPAFAFSGTYSVTFYNGPSHSVGSTQCIDFTSTGGVLGFTDSGTWDSSTFSGWGGNYVVDGKELRWYGTYDSGADVTNFYNKYKRKTGPGAGGFDEWTVSAPPITAVGDGITTMTSGCTASVHRPQSANPNK